MSKVDALRAMREQRYAERHALTSATARPRAVPSVRPEERAGGVAVGTSGSDGRDSGVPTPPDRDDDIPAPTVAPPSASLAGKPDLPPGRPIASYSDADIRALVTWITGQGIRGEDRVLDVVMEELGFVRKGKVIKARVGAALAEVQAA